MPRNPTSMIFGLLKSGSIEATDVDAIHVIARRLNLNVNEVRQVVAKQVKLERFAIDGSNHYCTRVSLVVEVHIPVTAEGRRQSTFAKDPRGHPIPAVITEKHPVWGKHIGPVTIIQAKRTENQTSQVGVLPNKEPEVVKRVASGQAIKKAELAFGVLQALHRPGQTLPTTDAMEMIAAELAEKDLPHGKSVVQKILSDLEATGHIGRKKQGFHGVSAVVHIADTFDEATFSNRKGLTSFAAQYEHAEDPVPVLLKYLKWYIDTNGDQFRVNDALTQVGVTSGKMRHVIRDLKVAGLRLKLKGSQPSIVSFGQPNIVANPKSPDQTEVTDEQPVIDGLIKVIEDLEEEITGLKAEIVRLRGSVIDTSSPSYSKATEILRRHSDN